MDLHGWDWQEKDSRMLIAAIVYEPATRRSTVKVTSFAQRPGTGTGVPARSTGAGLLVRSGITC